MAHVDAGRPFDLLHVRSQRSAKYLSLALGAKPKQITKFTDGRVLWPSIGYDGKAIVFERDFKV